MGFSPVSGSQFNRFNVCHPVTETNSFNGSVWSGGAPTANIGESVFVYSPLMLPIITQQPASQITTDGQPVTFTVSATGPPPLGYSG